MKTFITLVLVIFCTHPIFSETHYYYKGKQIDLHPREDKIAIILKNNNFSEENVIQNIGRFLGSTDKLKRVVSDVYLIDFGVKQSDGYINNFLELLGNESQLIKNAERVFYGSSKKVTQIITDRFIIKLRSNLDIDKLNAMNILNNCTVTGNSNDGKLFFIRSFDTADKNALELSEIYFKSGLFEYAEPDFIFPEGCLLLSIPNDINFPKQWALNNTGQLLQTGSSFTAYGDATSVNGIPDADMNVSNAWDFTTGSPLVKIGIIDSGIDSLHPDLQQAGHLLSGYDAFQDINSSAIDVSNHGTSTAGLIGAVMNNSIGTAGVAPSCPLMSINIFDVNGNTSSSIIGRAFDTARVRGLDILNSSWGGSTPQSIVTDAINNAALNGRNGLGCIILFSSGNDGRNPPVYPSILPNVLCVGSSTPHDQAKAPGTGNYFFWGSNYGENEMGDLDMIAPTNCYTLRAGGTYDQFFYGTSASCANAAGVAALILSVNTSQSRVEVINNLLRGCDKIDNIPYQTDKQFGKWNASFGYGRVNALNSVRLAAGVDIVPPTINHKNVSSHSSTYPTVINAEIIDQNGSPVPTAGPNRPKIFFKVKKGLGSWTGYDSLEAYSNNASNFTFKIPSQGWETEVKYFIRARDNSGNQSNFPSHAPNEFWLCYFSVGNITSDMRKFSSFTGADFGATLSYPVIFGSFKILNTKVTIHMRHTYLDDEIIQIFSPGTDANNNRKCLFSTNGYDLDNIFEATVSDSASSFWKDGSPPYLNGSYKPEYNLKGLNGTNASGIWKILHFDRAVTDYAFFDSVKITLDKTTGVNSSAVRLNFPADSILNFDTTAFPDITERNFYVKNSGTSNLNFAGVTFTGTYAPMFSLVNTPPSSIIPGDSALFKVRLNTISGTTTSTFENAVMNINTNDPSKAVFRVSLQTNEELQMGLKNLVLKILIEGLYNKFTNITKADTLSVHLRNSFSPYSFIDTSVAVVNTSGTGIFNFSNSANNTNYYIVTNHRNGLETWSASGISFINSQMTYDFTNDSSKAFGNNTVLKGAKYCIYSGDIDKDMAIDAADLGIVDNSALSFVTGYVREDLNGDNFVDATDMGICENNAGNFIVAITP
ncbi:MAG: S8 family serine peptidase [Ignavibacteria bacterium]